MTANEVIDCYVSDITRLLPRKERNDVAFELHALLADELAAKASSDGREPDREMVMDLLSAFGRPAEAAARYRPQAPLIDPADNHHLLIWSIVGSLVVLAADPANRLAFLQWVGGVFVFFSLAAWVRRRWPSDGLRWRPRRDPFPAVVRRPLVASTGLAVALIPLTMYLVPQAWWEFVTLGNGVSSGLALSGDFLSSWQRATTALSLAAVVLLYTSAVVQGGWRVGTRRALIAAWALVGAMLLVHAAPLVTLLERQTFRVFESEAANGIAMPIFALVGGITLLWALYDAYREWARVSPAPRLPDPQAA